ncbi:TPA: hypothetical protein N0F65_004898 [Lagenidium giganteum]|uniref:C2 domain-containing protein n=1 Tax=Lagenidium giganteum TaxID=4803 RepID=A0AAV2YND8_9STRA|nr:TPA: hypothetical protein N0F65_004898 [Lagenidium giganteum]
MPPLGIHRGARKYRLLVRVHCAENLRHVSSAGAYCKLYVGESAMLNGTPQSIKRFLALGETELAPSQQMRMVKTQVYKDSRTNPTWNEKFEIAVLNPETEVLSIRVKNARLMSRSSVGACSIPIATLRNEMTDQWVTLQDGKKDAGRLRVQLRLLAPSALDIDSRLAMPRDCLPQGFTPGSIRKAARRDSVKGVLHHIRDPKLAMSEVTDDSSRVESLLSDRVSAPTHLPSQDLPRLRSLGMAGQHTVLDHALPTGGSRSLGHEALFSPQIDGRQFWSPLSPSTSVASSDVPRNSINPADTDVDLGDDECKSSNQDETDDDDSCEPDVEPVEHTGGRASTATEILANLTEFDELEDEEVENMRMMLGSTVCNLLQRESRNVLMEDDDDDDDIAVTAMTLMDVPMLEDIRLALEDIDCA